MHSCVSIAAAASRGRDQQIGGSLRPRTAVGKSQLWAEPEMRGLAVGGESLLLNPAKILTVLTSLGADQSAQRQMRCTPVGTWTTNRSKWRGPGKDREPVVTGEEAVPHEAREDERVDQQTHLKSKAATYTNAYDVGFIFEALWKKRFDKEDERRMNYGYSCPDVLIPDTIIYRSGFPAQWYFQSKVERGRILKKNKKSLTIPTIYDKMSAWNGSCETQIVACFVGTTGRGVKSINNIVYFDRHRLKDFLYSTEKTQRTGFLQRFVAPEEIPYDHTATNVTLHVSWSRYKCIIEQRSNKMKLNDRKAKMSDKVNISPQRVDTSTINPATHLWQKLNEQCTAMADHIKATTFDKTEITKLTAYFKIGQGDALFLLFVSSVSVAPQYEDALGYIISLKTFAGRHSPDLACPEFFGIVDAKLKDAVEHDRRGHCALCNISSEDDTEARAFAVTYRMLAQYSASDRAKMLQGLQDVSLPHFDADERQFSGLEHLKDPEMINLPAKAAALYALLDDRATPSLSKVELWAGLLDFGYTAPEIALMLDLLGPFNSAHEHDVELRKLDEQSDSDEIATSPRRPCSPSMQQNSKPEAFGAQNEAGGSTWSAAVIEGSEGASVSAERSFESAQSTVPHSDTRPIHSDIGSILKDVPLAKDIPSSEKDKEVSLTDFIKGVQAVYDTMSTERKHRFVLNVDMSGDTEPAASVQIKPSSPGNMYSSVVEDRPLAQPAKVDVVMDFAQDCIERSRARTLARRLPKSLENLQTVLPASHIRRIISSDSLEQDFGETRIWCCRRCASKFNKVAGGVFEWMDKQSKKKHTRSLDAHLATLRTLKTQARLYGNPSHSYPVGELPALCTPRMYQALHDHASRSYTVGPPQFTPGGGRDILGETFRERRKAEFRRPRLPPLNMLAVEHPKAVEMTQLDADMSDLLDRLGLTPRRPVKGRMGSQFKPNKAGQSSADKAFEWLEG